jgi:hypothetical protein
MRPPSASQSCFSAEDCGWRRESDTHWKPGRAGTLQTATYPSPASSIPIPINACAFRPDGRAVCGKSARTDLRRGMLETQIKCRKTFTYGDHFFYYPPERAGSSTHSLDLNVMHFALSTPDKIFKTGQTDGKKSP